MKLWFALRDRRLNGFKFVREEAIGSYIVDFVCREAKLVIEVDGGQHADSRSDDARDAALSAEGYRVLRGARVAHRVRGAALQDEDYGANMRACTSDAASSIVMNTAPAAIRSFNSPSSASIR